MIDTSPIGFRRMVMDDLHLLHRWLQLPQVLEWWWGGVAPTYEAVAEKYGPDIADGALTRAYLMLYADQPIGYIQTYRIRDYPEYAAAVGAEEEAAGVDLLIGEEKYLHKGLGSHILRRFLHDVVFVEEDIASCIIGPSETNVIAIRAYEKAGFTYFRTIPSTDEPTPEYLMRIGRDDLQSEYNCIAAHNDAHLA